MSAQAECLHRGTLKKEVPEVLHPPSVHALILLAPLHPMISGLGCSLTGFFICVRAG